MCISLVLHSSALAAVLLLQEDTDIGAITQPSQAISVEIVASSVLEAMQQKPVEDQAAASEATARNAGETAPEQATEKPVKTEVEPDKQAEPKEEVASARQEMQEAAPQQSEKTEHEAPKPVVDDPAPVLAVPQSETKTADADETTKTNEEAKARLAAEVARKKAEKREEERREARRKEEEHKKQRNKAREGGATAKSTFAGSAQASRASASAGSILSYAARVRAQVAGHKPSSAGGRGTAVVSFGVTASGGLGYASLARSSGNAALDQRALSAVRGAAPFPAPPAGASGRQLQFTIPFHFE